MKKSNEKLFSDLMDIMYELRKKCPWDKKQTQESLRQYLLEETYEVLETIDRKEWTELSKELGDLLLQIVFQSVIAEEEGRFTINEVISNINNKLIERHPHVFGKKKVETSGEVAENWEHIKMNSENRKSLLSGIPEQAPALLYAQRMQEKAAKVGFDWQNINDVIEKLDEETYELKEAINSNNKSDIKEELGDLLFSVVNVTRFLKLNAEDCLRETNTKFKTRFEYIEKYFNGDYQLLKNASIDKMDELWEQAKKND